MTTVHVPGDGTYGWEGAPILPRDMARALRVAGGGKYLFEMIATCMGESGQTKKVPGYVLPQFRLWEEAWNATTPNNVDRGVCQLSSRWFPEVTDEEAYNYQAAARHMVRIIGDNLSTLNLWYAWSDYLSPDARSIMLAKSQDPEVSLSDQAKYASKYRASGVILQRAALAVHNDRMYELHLPTLNMPRP